MPLNAVRVSSLLSIPAIPLVLVHKLEYFANARIVGGEVHAKAWDRFVPCCCLKQSLA